MGSAWTEMWDRLWRIDTLFETGELSGVQHELADLAGAGVYQGPVELQLGLAAAAPGRLDAAAHRVHRVRDPATCTSADHPHPARPARRDPAAGRVRPAPSIDSAAAVARVTPAAARSGAGRVPTGADQTEECPG